MIRATILSTVAAFGIVIAGPLVDTVSDATLPYTDRPFVNSVSNLPLRLDTILIIRPLSNRVSGSMT